MNRIDSKKKLEQNLESILEIIPINELINDSFINKFFENDDIKKILKNSYFINKKLSEITILEKNEINTLLSSSLNNSSIKSFDMLIQNAKEFALIKKMKDMKII